MSIDADTLSEWIEMVDVAIGRDDDDAWATLDELRRRMHEAWVEEVRRGVTP